ncbi:MAG: DUF2780 domain-containing protein, partial [Solimonas sp.]
MSNIIGQLAGQFGVSPAQAESAAGSVFKLLQERAQAGDFQKLLGAVPQIQDWIAKADHAPEAAGGGGLLGQLGGLLGGGGGGGFGGVLAALQQSGLKPETLVQFVPALLEKLSAHVDPALLAKVLDAVPALKELEGAGGGLGGL